MAEAAVSFVIDKLIASLNEEVKPLTLVHRDVADIKDELESIRSFLRDADARLERDNVDDGVKTWVKQVREVAYRIEDVIDLYLLRVAKRRDHNGYKFKAFLHMIARWVKSLRPSQEIASEIQDIRKSVLEIKERSLRYSFVNTYYRANEAWHDPRVGSLFVEEAELVGIESARNELISVLLGGEQRRTVVSMVGMGGIGKTTLAKKVFDNENVVGHFECHAWITVSQSYKLEDLLRNIIKQFYKEINEYGPVGIDTMDETSVISKLRAYLSEKRYLIVFDDVWKLDFWGDVEHALLDNNRGSRVIITTRILGVADFCKKSSLLHVHPLKPLPLEEAQELLCNKAFRFPEEKRCPPELEKLSFDIVRRCSGLPLAIVAIGGLLSTKGGDLSQWRNLHDSLSSELECNPHLINIKRILSFSYHELPYYLKSCLLYLGMFPEDLSINCARLIRLWIANGFVKGKSCMTLEKVAEGYLTELIHRNLIQVSGVYFDGKARYCRVHDLVREVILSRSEELNIHVTSIENSHNLDGTTRHLSICNKGKSISDSISISNNTKTRSIIPFEVNKLPNSSVSSMFANFKLLRALDFKGAWLDSIPKELGNLLHLRYLSLRDTRVKTIPSSIGKLQQLETLDLKRSLVYELPAEIYRLSKLQYLLAYCVNYDGELNRRTRRGVKIKYGLGRLGELLKLSSLNVENDKQSISELGRLKQLRRLEISMLKAENGKALCVALEKMSNLQSLSISAVIEEETLELQSMLSPPLLLQRLLLKGRLERLPHWVSKVTTLVRVSFFWSRLKDDPLEVLGTLPNLLDLWFYKGYDGEKLHLKGGNFKKLKGLGLRCLHELNELIIDEGALPSLEGLAIGSSPQLKAVPDGIFHVKSLESLEFWDMPRDFARRMLPNEGEDYWKVKHVPGVLFHYSRGIRYRSYKLADVELLAR